MTHRSLRRSGTFRRTFARCAISLWVGGCSWQRYDDITETTPVLVLEAPGGTHQTGLAVAAMPNKQGKAQVFALELEGYVLYDLGKKEPSSTDAFDQGRCERADGCFVGESVAAIHRTVEGVDRACFAFAVSQPSNGNLRTQLYCEGNEEIALRLDATTESQLGKLGASSSLQLKYASGPRRNPQRLVAAVASKSALWYFPSPSSSAISIALPKGVGQSFGRSLVLMDQRFDSSETGATLVVGEPDANRVHFLAVDYNGAVSSVACLEGPSGFASQMTAGYFVDATQQGLAVSTATALSVIPNLTNFAEAASQGDGCVQLDDLQNVRTLACKKFGLEVNCDSPLTRGSLAPADLNGDAIDELVVGVPMAFSGGSRAAGQLLTLSMTDNNLKVRERLSPSSIESGDRLGESIVAVPLSRPDVVLAGAPGGNKLATFYCSALLPAGLGGKRCE